MTGQFPHQAGLYSLRGGYDGPLDPDLPSVARPFRDAGYRTVYAGKWHLGGEEVAPEEQLAAFGWDETLNLHEISNPTKGTPADTSTRDGAVDFLSASDGNESSWLGVLE